MISIDTPRPFMEAYNISPGTLFEVRHEVWLRTCNGAVRFDSSPLCHVGDKTLRTVEKFGTCKLSDKTIKIYN